MCVWRRVGCRQSEDQDDRRCTWLTSSRLTPVPDGSDKRCKVMHGQSDGPGSCGACRRKEEREGRRVQRMPGLQSSVCPAKRKGMVDDGDGEEPEADVEPRINLISCSSSSSFVVLDSSASSPAPSSRRGFRPSNPACDFDALPTLRPLLTLSSLFSAHPSAHHWITHLSGRSMLWTQLSGSSHGSSGRLRNKGTFRSMLTSFSSVSLLFSGA